MSDDGDGATDSELFWELIDELQLEDQRVEEGTIMGGRCVRVDGEFLALVDHKGSGMVVKLPAARVAALIAEGVGAPFAPAGRVFREWIAVGRSGSDGWPALLREGTDFVAPNPSG